MTYVVPQVQVFQEINTVPVANAQPFSPHISGGHAKLIRHAEASEKESGSLGQYAETTDTAISWPNKPVGAIVDQEYTKLHIDDALLQYLVSNDGDTVNTVNGYPNRVTATALKFKTNTASYPRSAVFLDRDVAVGDVARVRATVSSVEYELCTYVAGFASTMGAAVVGAAAADAGNPAADTAESVLTRTDVDPNLINFEVVSATGYHGPEIGLTADTLTIEVIEGSVGGDFSTAVLKVTSASGLDDYAAVNVGSAVVTTPFELADTGITLRVVDNSLGADTDLVAGQTYTLSVAVLYTVPAVASGGTYTGDVDDTYVVEVTRGGDISAAGDTTNNAQITVRTAKGLDISGPSTITTAIAKSVGTKGATITFTTVNSLVKGSVWTVAATATTPQNVRTLILGHSMPQAVVTATATAPVAVQVDLYIRKDIEVSANRIGAAPLTNWSQTASEITLNSGITAFDSTYTDAGVPIALNVVAKCNYSNAYVEARYWINDLSAAMHTADDVSQLEDLISGALHPDNPLKWGVFKALQNSNTNTVTFTSVCNPADTTDWSTVLNIIDGKREAYALVPLTTNPVVWSLFEAHVNNQSSASTARWRKLWISPTLLTEIAVCNDTTSSDAGLILAVAEDNPLVSGTQYTQLRVPAANANFVTSGVRAGDIVRYLYTADGFGGATYSEYVIDEVVGEDLIKVQTGPDAAVATPSKLEVWRTISAADAATELAQTGGFGNRRVCFVLPEEVESDGYVTPGYFLAAALAGLSCGVAPQQGLTHLAIAGFSGVSRITNTFNSSQLNAMAAGGALIVTQEQSTGDIFARHAVTTGDTDNLAEREEMVVRNLDSISYRFLDTYAPYIGVSNVVNSSIAAIRAETRGTMTFLTGANFIQRLGGQLVDGEIVEVRQHATLRDRLVVVLNLTLPFPMNNIEVHLQLVA